MEEKKDVKPTEEAKTTKKLTELKVTYGALTEKNREVLAIINKLCLPVTYSNDFYLSLALNKEKYCRFGTSLTPHPLLSILQGYSNRRHIV